MYDPLTVYILVSFASNSFRLFLDSSCSFVHGPVRTGALGEDDEWEMKVHASCLIYHLSLVDLAYEMSL